MRVITGMARGAKLHEPIDMNIRPTTDMVKEALFSIIQFDIEGRKVLDLFAGTGQLGIEALSRGANSCTFVDQSKDSIKLIKENLEHCKLKGDIVREDSIAFLKNSKKYDIIFLDPPYAENLLENALEKIIKFDILAEGGIIICETASEKHVKEVVAPYEIIKEYKYGKIRLTTITRRADNQAPKA